MAVKLGSSSEINADLHVVHPKWRSWRWDRLSRGLKDSPQQHAPDQSVHDEHEHGQNV